MKVGHLHCTVLVLMEEVPVLDIVGCVKSSNLLSASHLPATVPEASPSFNKHFVVIVVDFLLSRVQLFVTPWTVAHEAPLSMGFSRQEYWSGLPFPPPGNVPDLWVETCVPCIGRWFL